MKNFKEIKATIKNSKEELREKFKVKEIGIFGSFVRKENKKKSDVDILVEFEEGADLFDLIDLGFFLEKKLKRKVDVVSKRTLRKEIKKTVLRELVNL